MTVHTARGVRLRVGGGRHLAARIPPDSESSPFALPINLRFLRSELTAASQKAPLLVVADASATVSFWEYPERKHETEGRKVGVLQNPDTSPSGGPSRQAGGQATCGRVTAMGFYQPFMVLLICRTPLQCWQASQSDKRKGVSTLTGYRRTCQVSSTRTTSRRCSSPGRMMGPPSNCRRCCVSLLKPSSMSDC